MKELDHRDGERAVSFARQVIERHLDGASVTAPDLEETALSQQRGAFVTLEADGSLRGCVGRPYPDQPAVEAIRDGAIDAATADPRFPPVTPRELNEITVEVSVLSAPEPVTVDGDRSTLPIDVGRDGLIVESDGRSGLLLPQVAVEYDWDPVEFLEQTCRKAGLSGACWTDGSVTVERFSADVFAERVPRGPVEEVPVGESAMA